MRVSCRYPGQPVRAFSNVIALAVDSPIQPPNPRGVEDFLIDFHPIVIEPGSQRLETALHEFVIAGGQFYTVKKISAVSGVADNWVGPPVPA